MSLDADKKGINMSRIMRVVLRPCRQRVQLRGDRGGVGRLQGGPRQASTRGSRCGFPIPMEKESLRSGLTGWQYYDIALEVIEKDGVRLRVMHLGLRLFLDLSVFAGIAQRTCPP